MGGVASKPCSKFNKKGDIVGISGIAAGSVTGLFIAGEYGINYFGDALYYGVIVGCGTSLLVYAGMNHFNIGEMTTGGIGDFLAGAFCGIFG